MPEAEALIKLGRRIWARIRKRKAPSLPAAIEPELISSTGYRIFCQWFPQQNPEAPILLLCPDHPLGAAAFLEERYPLSCTKAYQQGYSLLLFDPAGRGKSWGTEDYGGLEHQDNVRVLIEWLHKQSPQSPIGIFSMGCGLSMALGGLQQEQTPISFLIDFEGPCDVSFLAQCYGISPSTSDTHFWKYRTPITLLDNLKDTRFIRMQAEQDHLFASDLRNVSRLFRALEKSNARRYQLNNHPIGSPPPQPQLLIHDETYIQQEIHQMLDFLNPEK